MWTCGRSPRVHVHDHSAGHMSYMDAGRVRCALASTRCLRGQDQSRWLGAGVTGCALGGACGHRIVTHAPRPCRAHARVGPGARNAICTGLVVAWPYRSDHYAELCARRGARGVSHEGCGVRRATAATTVRGLRSTASAFRGWKPWCTVFRRQASGITCALRCVTDAYRRGWRPGFRRGALRAVGPRRAACGTWRPGVPYGRDLAAAGGRGTCCGDA